jgi:hypothetical protein
LRAEKMQKGRGITMRHADLLSWQRDRSIVYPGR